VASASLVSTSFGFPTIVQSSNAVAFQQDTADAIDFETINIDFPTLAGGLCGAGLGMAFPSISQTSLQSTSMTHTEFAQTSECAQFSYPFVGVGAACLPGFGF
jgi:hypothetical protein